MSKIYLLCLAIMLMSCQSELTPDEIIDRSIEAHGGWENWQQLDTVSYQKDYNLYLEDGSLERKISQKHTTTVFPTYQNHIVNTDGSVLMYDGNRYTKSLGDSILPLTASDTGLIHSSLYVLAQPFKLKDPGSTLTDQGMDTLFTGQVVRTIRVDYETPGKENHPWWYYFDPETFVLVANKVHHVDYYSLITNDEYVEYKGILWNRLRTGYRVDEDGQLLYKRADYVYTFE